MNINVYQGRKEEVEKKSKKHFKSVKNKRTEKKRKRARKKNEKSGLNNGMKCESDVC